MSCLLFLLRVQVKENSEFWVVTRTGIEGNSSNGDTSGDNMGFPHIGGIPVFVVGQEMRGTLPQWDIDGKQLIGVTL